MYPTFASLKFTCILGESISYEDVVNLPSYNCPKSENYDTNLLDGGNWQHLSLS